MIPKTNSSVIQKACFLILLIVNILYSCTGNDKKNHNPGETKISPVEKRNWLTIEKPLNGSSMEVGSTIGFAFKISNNKPLDSILVFINSEQVACLKPDNLEFQVATNNMNVGSTKIRVKGYFSDDYLEEENIVINLLSDIIPDELNYRILKEYPHDIHAYTQGLYYEKGILYESTGQYGQSSLRKINMGTGEILNVLQLPDNVFGEGIAIYNNSIIQITWKEQVGFIYDKQSFALERRINYPIKQGWGITFDGDEFLMSDGSNIIYFIDTTYFSELRRIEVYDNKGSVNNINELEYINGQLYANVYGSNLILIIDPESGKVISRIDFKDLLKALDKQPGIDVFNGIAFNPDNGNLFVTGKNWPKLFEIKLE